VVGEEFGRLLAAELAAPKDGAPEDADEQYCDTDDAPDCANTHVWQPLDRLTRALQRQEVSVVAQASPAWIAAWSDADIQTP